VVPQVDTVLHHGCSRRVWPCCSFNVVLVELLVCRTDLTAFTGDDVYSLGLQKTSAQVPAYLIQAGGETLQSEIQKLINSVWRKE
jgi:hypothetical protein